MVRFFSTLFPFAYYKSSEKKGLQSLSEFGNKTSLLNELRSQEISAAN